MVATSLHTKWSMRDVERSGVWEDGLTVKLKSILYSHGKDIHKVLN